MTSQDPAAQSLQRAEAELRVLQLTTGNIPISLHFYHLEEVSDDRILRMVYANPAVKTLTGPGPEDVVSQTLDENCPGLRAKSIPQRYAEVMRSQTAINFENIIAKPVAPERLYKALLKWLEKTL